MSNPAGGQNAKSVQTTGGDEPAADTLVALAEARWERGEAATLETFVAADPRVLEDRAACRALLMCEAARRTEEPIRQVRADMIERWPDLASEVDAVIDLLDLARSVTDDAAVAVPPLEPGLKRGKYTLLEMIGSGAFGEVWRALDSDLDRQVALKILYEFGRSERRIAEARAAAALDHEHIVRVHDAGTFEEDGRCYIDSQLVGDAAPTPRDPGGVAVGRSLETVVREKGPRSPRDAAWLMEPVCRAIAAAHARGIVHRDLKPANILLTPSGKPLVSDFGLAASVDEARRGTVGTPLYMSPEQARGEPATPLSDIYSLGATLRFLLTGSPPYAPSAGARSVRSDVIEQVSRGETLPLDQARPGLPRTLAHICERAMHADPSRRYESAQAFATDLAAWLTHRPTLANPPGLLRSAWLTCRRNALVTGVAAAAVVVLVVTTATFVVRLRHQRDRAIAAEQIADKKREEAEQGRTLADGLNQMVSQSLFAAVSGGDGSAIPTGRVLLAAERRLELLKDNPAAEAGARHMLGEAYLALGQVDQALKHLERAVEIRTRRLGPEHADTLRSRRQLAMTEWRLNHKDRAEEMLRGLLEPCERVLGPDHPETCGVLRALGQIRVTLRDPAGARVLLEQALAGLRRSAGPGHPEFDAVVSSLTIVAMGEGRFDEAVPLARELEEAHTQLLGADDIETLTARRVLGEALSLSGKHDEAVPVLEDTYARAKSRLGSGQHSTSTCGMIYAESLLRRAEAGRGLEVIREVIAAMPNPHGSALFARASIIEADCLIALGRGVEAINPLREAYKASQALLPKGHVYRRRLATLLTDQLRAAGRAPEAEEFQKSLEAGGP